MPRHADCKICTMLETTPPESLVLAGAHWGVVAMREAPGVLMAFTRDHDQGVGSISDAAADAFGPLIKTLSTGLTTSGFEKTSVISFGDNAIHTHFMLVGRKPADAPIFDNTPLMARLDCKEGERARAVAGHLRDVLKTSGLTA
ncbi:hypothetical protein [Brevundimonas sp. P7753]|uniref:hypothetical protein n=1 Tax=Brevundimonas sp. P7753 TaxID=2726982 RepID=UPI0015B854D9|nr:hypothetical protein [Brevundimonas sp. P7753]NWE54023.1 hypothetical protein [Brevundimonas sp. P7753]